MPADNEHPERNDELENVKRQLETAGKVLAVYEEQAAGYTKLTIPADLQVNLDEQRKKVAALEARIATLEGRAPEIEHPDNLPRREPFFGRRDEIEKALRALRPEARTWGVIVDGIGGIGKTALALEVAHLCREAGSFDAFLFLTAKQEQLTPTGIRPTTLSASTLDGLLDETARLLNEQGIAQLPAGETKQRALLDGLRGRRALLIYDNLETLSGEEQAAIGGFLTYLPPDCKGITTSRYRSGESAVTIRLEKLEWEDAHDLIQSQMERNPHLERALKQAGEARWVELYDEAGGSPLALKWTLGLMAARSLSFDKTLALLRDGSAEADLNEFIYREARRDMDEHERAVLGTLSLFAQPAGFDPLSATADLSRRALEGVLERLVARSLVDVTSDETYTLHPLTRRMARADLAADPETEWAAGDRFAGHWLAYAERYGGGDKDAYQTYDQLEAEWPNLEAAGAWLAQTAGVAGIPVGETPPQPPPAEMVDEEAARRLNRLARALWQFLWFCGRWDEWGRLSAWAYAALAAREEWRDAGWQAHRAGWIFYSRDQLDAAERWGEAMEAGGGARDRASATRFRGLVA